MDDPQLYQLAFQVGTALKTRGAMLVTAESRTGGWLGQVITSVAGSTAWDERGFITYSEQSKRELLGISADTLTRYGAVSEATVREMATGALRHSSAQIAVAVTGLAGPGGDDSGCPVGTVCLGWSDGTAIRSDSRLFQGDRYMVRRQAVIFALEGLLQSLS